MKKGFSYLPIILFCTALFTGYGAKAQDELRAVPDKVAGNWALPDCRAYEEALMITRHFYLKSTKQGSQLWPVESLGQQKDYWLLPIEDQQRPIRRETDGILKVGIPADKTVEKWPKEWDGLKLDTTREYMRCAYIPALLPDPLVRVMKQIDDVRKTCSRDMSKSCKKLLFKIADSDRNNKISVTEMKMAGAMLAGVATLAEKRTATRDVLDKAFLESLKEGDRIVAEMTPEGRELGYKDFSGFLQKANSALLQNALISLGTEFPAFKQAALTMPVIAEPPQPSATDRLWQFLKPSLKPLPEYPSQQ